MWGLPIWETNFNSLSLLDGLTESYNFDSGFVNTCLFFYGSLFACYGVGGNKKISTRKLYRIF